MILYFRQVLRFVFRSEYDLFHKKDGWIMINVIISNVTIFGIGSLTGSYVTRTEP